MMNKKGMTPAGLLGILTGHDGTPEGIERSERDGQRDFVSQQTLPIKGLERGRFESLGFIFGERPTDVLFIDCQFPPGWTKRPTDHSMWSELVDPDGNVVASIFYKAAFYDRDAFISMRK